MSMSIVQLQKQIELLTDEINDIFHATELNFDAIKIHLQIEGEPSKTNQKLSQPSQIKSIISQCQREFQSLKSAYKQRTNLRLEYLINEQIKSEQQKVRRERLLEYQDKIYDHRRLICDKESFYDSLIKPKTKRLPGMTNQQFQEFKMKAFQEQERQNFKQLQEETQILLKLQKFLRTYRISLEEEFDKYQQLVKDQSFGPQRNLEQQKDVNLKEKEAFDSIEDQMNQKYTQTKSITPAQNLIIAKQEQKAKVKTLLNSTPTIYSKFQNLSTIKMTPEAFQQSKKLLKQCLSISTSEMQLQKQYKEEREMYKYLKWEQTDLTKKYKKLQEEIQQLRKDGKVQKKLRLSF